jgi:hypothetical protein
MLRPDLLTVSMSCDWLFLGGLHSCIARFRFTSRFHHPSIGCNRKPTQGGGIFDRHNGEFSAGVDSKAIHLRRLAWIHRRAAEASRA